MTSQSRKHRGYRTQKVVADYLKEWWPNAESTGAGRQGSDITGVPFDIEVKARTAFQPKAWLDQARKRSKGTLSFVVMRFNGQGENSAEYGVMIQFSDLIQLLQLTSYSNEMPNPIRCKGCGTWILAGLYCSFCEAHNGKL